jgi:hypothetical protein
MENNNINCWAGQEGLPEWGDGKRKIGTPRFTNEEECKKENDKLKTKKYEVEQKTLKHENCDMTQEVEEKIKEMLIIQKQNKCFKVVEELNFHCKIGNLNIVKFIVNNFNMTEILPYLNKLFIKSCEYGQLEVAKWLILLNEITDTESVISNMKRMVLDYLYYDEDIHPSFIIDIDKAFDIAIKYKHSEVTEWLLSLMKS